MPTDSFIAELRKSSLNPVLKFKHDGNDKTAFLVSVGEIKRDINLMPGYVQVTVDNSTGEFNDYISSDGYLTKKCEIIFGLSGFANVTLNSLSFHNNGADPDTIEDSSDSLLSSGFKAGMVFELSGSTLNDGTYTILRITASAITLLATDILADEAAGDSVTMIAEELPLFTGYVCDFDGDDVKNSILTLRDRLSLALANKVQTAAGEAVWLNYFEGATRLQAYHVSDLVWFILTEYAKLDNTASTANTDIDYTSWLAWGVDVDNGGYTIYDIGVVANGELVSDVLMKIMQMTESVAWVGGAGKIKFMTGRTAGSWRTYKEEILAFPEINISMQDRINSITCKWGYQPDTDDWTSDTSGAVVDASAVGPTGTPYTYNVDIVQDPVVFHNTDTSAQIYVTARLNRTAAPPRYFSFRTQLLGWIEDIHSDIALQDLFDSPLDDIGIQINEITFIPEAWETRIIGQYYWTFA